MKKTLSVAVILIAFFLAIASVSAADLNEYTISNDNPHLNNLSQVNDNHLRSGDSKTPVRIDAPPVDLYYKNGSSFIVNLKDNSDNPIKKQNIIININGVNYTRQTNDYGIASMKLNLDAGFYGINVIFKGTDSYQSASEKSNATIHSVISGSNLVKYFRNDSQYFAKFVDGQGKPLVNRSVTFNINGVMYNRMTNEKGLARLNINLDPDKYVLTAIHPDNGFMFSNNITVLPTINGSNLVKYFRNNSQYYASFIGHDGNPLVKKSVTFNINGVMYNRMTNDKGIARLNINLDPNNYILTAIHPDNGFMFSNNITVLPTINGSDLKKVFRGSNQYYATFVDGSGNPLVNRSVTFNINGVMYNRMTNDVGLARLNINLDPNNYILTAIHPDNNYLHSNKIVVVSFTSTKLEGTNKNIYGTGNFTVTLSDSFNAAVIGKDVIFNINGKSYTRTTDNQGKANLNINLDNGKYPITYSFAGDKNLGSSSGSSTINVLNKIDTVISGKDTTIVGENNHKFSVILKDVNGKAVSNEKIVFTYKDKTVSATTNSQGVATLNNLPYGYYTINYKFDGNNQYNKSSGKNKILISPNSNVEITPSKGVLVSGESKFTVKLSSNGNPLANQEVYFKINGMTYKRNTDEGGIAKININLDPGSYNFIYGFNGNSYFKSANGSINLKVISGTTLEINSNLIFNEGKNESFSVVLKDKNGNLIPNKEIIFKINGVSYKKITNDNGVAYLNINLGIGTYEISYSFAGDSKYSKSNGKSAISVISDSNNIEGGYWVRGKDMNNINLASLSSKGVTQIFLNEYAIPFHGESNVVAWIAKAKKLNINVNIWMQCFFNNGWINPVDTNGNFNTQLFNEKVEKAKQYAQLEGINGILLDYLRYPGNAYKYKNSEKAVNEFTKLISSEVKKVNKNIILSAAIMPEKEQNSYYYGQNVEVLGKYLNVVIPMVYKGNYKAGTSWISTVTSWFVSNSQGAQVWAGLMAYKSDSDTTPLSASELLDDSQTAVNSGATGVILFRYGLSENLNFSKIITTSSDITNKSVSLSINDIKIAATNLKNIIESEGILPYSIPVGKYNLPVSQFLYVLAKATVNMNNNNYGNIQSKVIDAPNKYTGSICAKVMKDEYLIVADKLLNFSDSNSILPAYVSSSNGNIKYNSLIYMFTRVISFTQNNNYLPNFVFASDLLDNYAITVSMYPSSSAASGEYQYIKYTSTWLNYCPTCNYYGTLLVNPKGTPEGELTCAFCGCDFCGVSGHEKLNNPTRSLTRISFEGPTASGEIGDQIPIEKVLEAAAYVKTYYEVNMEIPDHVLVYDKEYSLAQYLYLASQAIVNLKNNNLSNISIIACELPTGPSGDIIASSINSSEYIDVSSRVLSFIIANGIAPNYATSSVGKIIYDELIDSFSRILVFYNENNYLPNIVAINYMGGSSSSISDLAESLTNNITSEYDKAVALFEYVRDNIAYAFYSDTVRGAEGTLIAGSGNCCDQAQLLAALGRSTNLTCRFVHGVCTFSSGRSLGHVWIQFNIDGKWYNADPTSRENSFNVIKNWNVNNYQLKGYYDVLPF